MLGTNQGDGDIMANRANSSPETHPSQLRSLHTSYGGDALCDSLDLEGGG